MWTIILTLGLGVFVGSIVKFKDHHMKINSKLQHLGVIGLLFFMGISIGLNKDLISQLNILGVKAIAFGVITTACSIIVVYLVTTFAFRRKSHDN